MAKKINRERLKAFLLRRRTNALGLSVITAFSAVCAVIAVLMGFKRADVLVTVTVLFMLLCFVQGFRMKGSFRTMRAFKGVRRKRKQHDA